MELTERELWAILAGLAMGLLILLAFTGSLVAIRIFRQRLVDAGAAEEGISPPTCEVLVDRDGERAVSASSQARLISLSPGADIVRSSTPVPPLEASHS